MMQELPSYTSALDAALQGVCEVRATEVVELHLALNRTIATSVVADRDLPPCNRSTMDGYAVVASEVEEGVTMNVIGEVAAGTTFSGSHDPMTCVSIATGAPLPDCFDAVVPHELTDCGSEFVVFQCDSISPFSSVHRQGVDAKEGDVLIANHTSLKPQHLSIAASVGLHKVEVLSKLKVIVVSSGDEIVSMNAQPEHHQMRNSNNPMLASVFQAMGCEIIAQHHIPDEQNVTDAVLRESLDSSADVLVTIGGISAGKRDYFKAAYSNAGVELLVKGANIQPGKPIIVGKHENAVILGLPGNPCSALVCACVFGWPIVRKMNGCDPTLPWQTAPLAHTVTPNPKRTAFRPCLLNDGQVDIPVWHGSGDAAHLGGTNGLAQLSQSVDALPLGEHVQCLAYPW